MVGPASKKSVSNTKGQQVSLLCPAISVRPVLFTLRLLNLYVSAAYVQFPTHHPTFIVPLADWVNITVGYLVRRLTLPFFRRVFNRT